MSGKVWLRLLVVLEILVLAAVLAYGILGGKLHREGPEAAAMETEQTSVASTEDVDAALKAVLQGSDLTAVPENK